MASGVVHLVILVVVLILSSTSYSIPSDEKYQPLYSIYSHYHWVWLHNSHNNQANNTKLVEDYLEHGIKVGVINIDSTWETGYNTFEFNPTKFPDPQTMINNFHEKGLKVTTWATGMINVDSPNYQHAFDNDFFLNDGQTVEWWKGEGSFLDYTNPFALDYWHSMIENLLRMGIDGFKLDGTDPHFLLLGPNVQGYAGKVTKRQYSEDYYGDFYNFTQEILGEPPLIMARPVDKYFNFAPRYAVFSGWVGDEDATFAGLRRALTYILLSGWRKYVGFGSDIGGYRCCEGEGREKELFLRWTQLGAFNPLMENGGGGEHRPWMYDGETTEIYRQFVDIHYQLVTYLYDGGVWAFENEESLITPLEKPGLLPERWDYYLGQDIFVAPIVRESRGGSGNSERTIEFPESDWVDWWNSSLVFKGETVVDYSCPLGQYPAFKRFGSVIPLDNEHIDRIYPFDEDTQPLTLVFSGLQKFYTRKIHGYDGQDLIVSYTFDDNILMINLVTSTGRFSRRPIILQIDAHPKSPLKVIKDTFALPFESNFFSKENLYKEKWANENTSTLIFVSPLTGEKQIQVVF